MEWYVFNKTSINSDKVGLWNVFNCITFNDTITKLLEDKSLSFKEFSKKVKDAAMYSFWAKYEYEVVVVPFPSTISIDEYENIQKEFKIFKNKYGHSPNRLYTKPQGYKKIDVFEQLSANWDIFVRYIWNEGRNND